MGRPVRVVGSHLNITYCRMVGYTSDQLRGIGVDAAVPRFKAIRIDTIIRSSEVGLGVGL